jgi:hypothetical protein
MRFVAAITSAGSARDVTSVAIRGKIGHCSGVLKRTSPSTRRKPMGTEERDRRRGEEPDVEAHKHRGGAGATEEPKTEPEDKAGDDAPDVEAHKHRGGAG